MGAAAEREPAELFSRLPRAALLLAAASAVLSASLGIPAGVALADPPHPSPSTSAAPSPSASAAPGRKTSPNPPAAKTAKTSPILAKLDQLQIAAEAVAERLNDAKVELTSAQQRRSQATDRLATATDELNSARASVGDWSRNAYIAAAGRPTGLPDDARNGIFGRPGPELDTTSGRLEAAEAGQRDASAALEAAESGATAAQHEVDTLQADLDRRGAVIRTLRTGRSTQLAAAEHQQDAIDSALNSEYLRDARGSAGVGALKAIGYALAQRGKPYLWGAEGPDEFDCSGLVQSAYAAAGISLPRTARPQFRATQVVSIDALLPGDLLFFATDKANWNTIHHVAIYLGHGLMLHAPTSGDVVRVAPIWWAEFFAATRVVPGRPGAKSEPLALPAAPGAPAAKPSRSPSPSPSKQPSPSPSRSPSPSPSGSGSPSPSPSAGGPSGSASPTPSGSPSPSKSAGPSPSPSKSPSKSPSAKPTCVVTATPSATVSLRAAPSAKASPPPAGACPSPSAPKATATPTPSPG